MYTCHNTNISNPRNEFGKFMTHVKKYYIEGILNGPHPLLTLDLEIKLHASSATKVKDDRINNTERKEFSKVAITFKKFPLF